MDIEKYEKGEYPQELQQAGSDIVIAGEELERAADKVAWSSRLAKEGYITRSELQADELAVKRMTIELDISRGKLDLLREYTHKKTLEELKSDVRQTELALERVSREARSKVVKAEVDLRAKESEFTRQKEKLERFVDQIAKCRVTAPVDGMVVYAGTGQGRPWHRQAPLDVGQTVRERRELFHFPTSSDMIAKLSIPESSRMKVTEGLPAVVRIGALANREITGRLTKISVLPDPTRAWLNPDLKVYRCEVELDESLEELRPGMSCRTEIILEKHKEAVYVPVQTVMRVQGSPTVYVAGQDGIEPRPVTTGLDNGSMVRIIDGLEPGEQVLLAPPLAESALPVETDAGATP